MSANYIIDRHLFRTELERDKYKTKNKRKKYNNSDREVYLGKNWLISNITIKQRVSFLSVFLRLNKYIDLKASKMRITN